MLDQREATVGGTPELMEAFGVEAARVAETLTRQSILLREARERVPERGRFPETDQALRAIVEGIRELGATASRAGAALRTADTTARMDIVFMTQSQFAQAFRMPPTAPPPITPAPTTTSPPPGPSGPKPASPNAVDEWRRLAYERAGVNTTDWDTTADMRTNDERIRAIWDRYGELYLEDPTHLWWAGMAKFAGATVYAGMMDLKSIVDLTDAEARREALREWLARSSPDLAGDAIGYLVNALVDLSGDQLDDFLDGFQEAQKAIADDLLWQHEVFRAGGLPALLPLIDQEHEQNPEVRGLLHDGWTKIASGDPAQVAAGTRDLVDVEQNHVLAHFYRDLRSSPAGMAFTEVLTFTVESPVPGGLPYREVMTEKGLGDRFLNWLGVPDPDVPFFRWGLPESLRAVEGNVTIDEDRWKWIKADMSPAYERFLAEHPDQMDQAMRTPVVELAHQRRKLPVPYEP